MIVLGIDPGIGRMGWGVIETSPTEKMLDYGCIETDKGNEAKRLLILAIELRKVCAEYRPAYIAIEQLFFSKNVSTAMSVSQARGVALMISAEFKIPTVDISPSKVKSVMGGGALKKRDIQILIQKQLKLVELPQPDDAADALAIALAGAAEVRWNKLIQK